MLIKQRNKPLVLKKLDAVIPRLPKHFPRLEEMKQEAARLYKGYIGEQKVDYHLDHLNKQATILQDVHLRVDGKNFQIDGLVITDHAIFCIEMKNFDGTITFNTILKQFTRNDGTREKGYRYPITQVETHQLQLMNWLQQHNYHNIPVHYFIAISDPSTIINVIGDQEAISKVVAHAEYIPKMIKEADDRLRAVGNNRLAGHEIGRAILQECKEQNFDILRKYGIKSSTILTGVHCPECGWLGMERNYGNWICNKCGGQSKHAHKRAISDYLQLFTPWITNKEARRFLHLKSKSVATRLLQSSNLVYQKEFRRWIKKIGAP